MRVARMHEESTRSSANCAVDTAIHLGIMRSTYGRQRDLCRHDAQWLPQLPWGLIWLWGPVVGPTPIFGIAEVASRPGLAVGSALTVM